MASPFQRYQSGIQPVTGMLETGAAIGKMYQQGLSDIGAAIGQGIKIYGENQKKSEEADANIASGIARFKQISDIYAQDPEFAPVVAQFAERMAQYQNAPSGSLAKKLAAANDINVLISDLGQSLQAHQVVRARQVERVGTEALDKFKDVKTVTDPAFINEGVLKFNTGWNFIKNEEVFMTGLKNMRDAARAAGNELKGTDAEAIESYRRNLTDSVNKAMTAGTLDKAVGQRIIEQVEAARKLDRQSQAAPMSSKEEDLESNSWEDFDIVTGTAYQPPKKETTAETETAPINILAESAASNINAKRKAEAEQKKTASTAQSEVRKAVLDVVSKGKAPTLSNMYLKWGEILGGLGITWDGQQYVDKNGKNADNMETVVKDEYKALMDKMGFESFYKNMDNPAREKEIVEQLKNSPELQTRVLSAIPESKARAEKLAAEGQKLANTKPTTAADVLAASEPKKPEQAPVVSLGRQVAGTIETEKKISIAERKSKVADFMTARIGVTDPVTGKKVLPAGFNAWFSKAVPESEARVVNVDGVQLLWDGQKFTQIKGADVPTMKEIRENMIGVYGTRDESGRLVATEFIPNSGVYLGGIFTGTDSADTKFREDMGNLIDARGSVRRLQEINDKFGESLSLRDAGIAEVDVMNLKAALRRDIVGVGQVSNYEQGLIDRVIKNPTDFLSLEPKDRAILLALAERIDRKIANNAAQYGLRAEIRGTEGGSRYQSLRQKYLAEKLK